MFASHETRYPLQRSKAEPHYDEKNTDINGSQFEVEPTICLFFKRPQEPTGGIYIFGAEEATSWQNLG